MDDSRQQTAMIKIGIVSEVDIGRARAKVLFEDMDNLESDWLPLVFTKTLKDQFYAMPDVGESVACMLDDNFETGVILGAIYDVPNPPRSPSETVDYIAYENGTEITIDHESGDIKIKTPGDVTVETEKKVTIKASEVLIDAPTVRITGHLKVSNGISSDKGGRSIVSSGDVIASNISLVEHIHGGVEPGGGTTGQPQ